MKKSISLAFVIVCLSAATYGQHNTAAQTTYNPQDVVNLESNFNNVLKLGKTGKYELYKFANGDKVMVATIGSRATGLIVMNPQGQVVPVTMEKKKVLCHIVSKGSDGTTHVFTVGCPKGVEDFIGKY